MRQLITVITVDNKVLTFRVDDYTEADDWIIFYDSRTNLKKKFPKSRCQIEEVRG